MKKGVALMLVFVFLTASCLTGTKPSSATSAAENTWTTKAPIPQAEHGVMAAAVNGKIYVMGGSSNYEYDPSTDNWAEKTPMPTPRNSFGIAAYQNKIYTIGGSSDGVFSGTNEVYDPSTDTWENKEPMPTNRVQIGANVVNAKIHLIGNDSHNVYDIATDSWTTGNSMLFSYSDYTYKSAVVNDKTYIIGWNQTQIYDSKTDSWSIGTSPPTSVSMAAVCATTGVLVSKRIYVIGGSQDLEGTDITQVYNPMNDTWTRGTPLPTARLGLTVAVVNDQIYAIAGSRLAVSSPVLTTNEQYTPLGYGTPDPSYESPTAEPDPTSPSNCDDGMVTGLGSTVLVAASVAVFVLASAGLIVYFKKRKH